jgi:hypothetical protein
VLVGPRGSICPAALDRLTKTIAWCLPLGLSLSCASAPPAPRPNQRVELPAPSPVPVQLSELLASGPKDRAPWVEPHPSAAQRPPFELAATVLSWGRSAALLQVEKSVFAASANAGLTGPLELPPGVIWVGFARKDALFAADAEGALWRADDLSAAVRAKGFRRINAISTALEKSAGAGPLHWSSAGDYLVAAFMSDVYVSSDGGDTFDVSTPARTLRLERVVARYDGVIVVQGRTPAQQSFPSEYQRQWAKLRGTSEVYVPDPDPAKSLPITLISSNAGRTWARSTFQPLELRVEGSWITGTAAKADRPARLLASDGKSWIDESLAEPPALLDWRSALRLGPDVQAYPPLPRRFTHAPGPPGRAPRPKQGQRVKPLPESHASVEMRFDHCRGAECLRGIDPPAPPPARFEYGFFSDAVCAAAGSEPARRECGSAPLVRPPSIGILDRVRTELTLARLPRGCAPRRLEGAAGIGVLLCDIDGKTRVELLDDRGRSFPDAELMLEAAALAPLTAAPDGTLLLQEMCVTGRSCTAHVRLPVALGAPNAWRAVTETDVIAFRAAPRGVVLVIAASPADARRVAVRALHPGGRRQELVVSEPLPIDLLQLGVESGQIVLTIGDASSSRREREVSLGAGGALLPR